MTAEIFYEVNGEQVTIAQVSKKYNLPQSTIRNGLRRKETMQEIVDRPQKPTNRGNRAWGKLSGKSRTHRLKEIK